MTTELAKVNMQAYGLSETRAADEAAAREADKKHRAKINNAAANALSGIVDEEQARAVIRAIAHGEVPNVTIRY